MTQNIYDDPAFFEQYSLLPRSIEGLAGAPEWPTLRAMLPDLHDLNVIDLGCGFGWFCRWAREQGAAQVLGIDVSRQMLAKAQAHTTDPAITYSQANLEHLDLPAAQFHLAYSSLALHYIEDLGSLLATVRRALVPAGRLVFSVEHPIYLAPREPTWTLRENGQVAWPIDSYLTEGIRTPTWLTQKVVKYHRTLGTILNLLIQAGLTILRIEEWGPSDQQMRTRPNWARERERPMFLLISVQRS